MTPIEQLQAAGFQDSEISAWATQQRATLTAAGFADHEIDDYLAGPKEPVPQPFVDRLRVGTAILDGDTKPAAAAYPEASMKDYGPGNFLIGLWKGLTLPADELKKQISEAGPGEAGGALIGRVPIGQIIDQIRSGGASLGAALSGEPVSAEEMVGNALLGLHVRGAPITSTPEGVITRMERDPATGGLRETKIGELPKPTDFTDAAKVVAGTDVPHPPVVEKLKQLWREDGIHPSEVAHDAHADPTIAADLMSSTDKLPEAYRPEGKPPEPIPEKPLAEGEVPPPEGDHPPLPEPTPDTPAESDLFFQPNPDAPSVGMGLGAAKPQLTPDEAAVMEHISVGERTKKPGISFESLYTNAVDRLHPIPDRDLAGNVIKTGDNPYRLMRELAGNEARAQGWLRRGQVDYATGDKIGPSLQEILAPVRHDLDPLRAFMDSVRAIELEGKGVETGFPMEAARAVAKAGEKKFAPIMAQMVEYQNNLIKYMRDAGVVTDEAYRNMTQEHTSYVPFHAVLEEARGGKGGTMQPDNPLFRIEGSARKKIDPLESIVEHSYQYVAMAERNKAANALVDLLAQRGEASPATSATNAAAKVRVFEHGVEKFYEVPQVIADTVKNVDGETAGWLARWLGSDRMEMRLPAQAITAPARLLRAGSTLTPDFIMRNPLRDYVSALLQSEKPIFTPVDSVKGFLSAVTKDEYFRRWEQGGGGKAELVAMDRRYLQDDLRKLTTDTGLATRAWNVIKNPVDVLRTISEYSEQATRLGEFRHVYDREIAAGATADDASRAAAYASREVTVDFARRGAITQSLNMVSAFWNASLQGTDRFARQMIEHPVATSLKVAAGITLPSVLLWYANHDDPRYREMPSWERDMFWNIMLDDWKDMGPAAGQKDAAPYAVGGASWRVVGGRYQRNDGAVIRMPKPFEAGVMFGSGVERMLDSFFTENPGRLGDFVKSIENTLVPIPGIPTAAIPFIEQTFNKSTFTGQALIPQYLEKQLPEYQYTNYTTETAKALGKIIGAFPGIKDYAMSDTPAAGIARAITTPILMENYVRAWTGGGGMYVLQLADAGLRSQGILPNPVKPDDTLADIPFVKAFVVRYPSANTDSLQHFHDEFATNQRYFDSWKARAADGDPEAMQRIQQAGGPRMMLQLDSMNKTLGEQAKLIRDIYSNPNMKGSEKRQLIDTLYYTEIQIAQQGLDMLRKADQPLALKGH